MDWFYVYGPTGLVAVNDGTNWNFIVKDDLGSTRYVFKGGNQLVSWYSYTTYGDILNSYINTDIAYKFTGQEYDNETNLWNFRARLYDSGIERFYASDPAGQGFAPYSYCGNNPVIFVDKDGRWFGLDDAIAAAIGGIVNLGVNLFEGHVHNFWQGLGYFGAGAAAGDLGLYGPAGWAAGGAILGASNTLLQGGNAGQAIEQGVIGGISSLAGGAVAGLASSSLGGVVVNGINVSAQSAVGGMISGAIGGAAGGFAGGFTTGLITTGNLSSALEMGVNSIASGAETGSITGAVSNIAKNIEYHRDWLSGNYSTLYHYTDFDPHIIKAEGLNSRTGENYVTPDGDLSPAEAQSQLSLNKYPTHLLEIDATSMMRDGYTIPLPSIVAPVGNWPGGGIEIMFPHPIPGEYIKVLR